MLAANSITEEFEVEVKIGVVQTTKEFSLDSSHTSSEIESTVTEAVKSGGVLSLKDEKGRVVIVPIEKLAYVEIGEPTERRVGFGNI